ncbi:MAG: TraG family conjugative transposon ATPase [Bacteroidota bacterium]|nr:TraG family conjugative transposon ATPase [Bacteroidota bacterium]MDP4272653.1 TraG family conjugative transposon ATPase [Bacteroidota bacterium]
MIIDIKDLYNIYKIDGNCVLNRNGDIVLYFSMQLPEIYSPSENDYEMMQTELYRFIKTLPSNTIIHIQNVYLEKTIEKASLPGFTFLQKATQEYYEGKKYLEHTCFMYVILPGLESLQKNFSLSVFSNKNRIIREDLEKIISFQKEVDKAIATLNTSRQFKVSPLDEYTIKDIIFNFLVGYQPGKLTDINFEPFKIGSNYYNCYAICNQDNLPEKIYSCKKDGKISTDRYIYYKAFTHSLGLELKCNHVINQFIFKEDHHRLKIEIEKTDQEFRTFSKFSKENEHNFKTIDGYLEEMAENENIRLCRAHYNVFTFANTTEGLNKIEKEITTAFSELDLIPYSPIYIDHAHYFLSSIPGNASFMPKGETYMTDINQALVFTQLVGNYEHDEKGILLNDRVNNTPILKDLWEKPYATKQILARNFAVIAETGGGKSFFTTHMYRTYIEQNYSLILCDIGDSNEGIATLYKDKVQYIRYKEGEPFGINPFLLSSKEGLTAAKIETLSDFVFIHWLKEKKPEDTVRVSMNSIISDYYLNCQERYSFPSFYNYVKKEERILDRLEINPEFFNRDEFLHVCNEYVTGIYDFLYADSGLFDRGGEKGIVFYELSEALNNPTILPIMFLMIRDTIDNKIWKNSENKKVLVYEEAAKLLKYQSMITAMDYIAQTVRKYEGGMGLILQTIDNIPDDTIGKAILNNTHTFFIFEQDKGLESLKHRLKLSDHDVSQLLSLRSNQKGKPPYTEFAIKLGKKMNCYRLEVPREVYWAYVSDKDQKKPLFEEYQKTGNFESSIKKMIEHESH